MNKSKFFERYKNIFHTTDFKSTYAAYLKLSIEERNGMKKKALSESSLKWHQENKDKFKQAMTGHTVSDATKEKISKSNSKYYENIDNRKKTSDALKKAYKENPKNKKSIEKQRESLKKTYENNPEIRQRISNSLKKYYAENPNALSKSSLKTAMQLFYETEKGKENLKILMSARTGGPSRPELELQNFVRGLCSDSQFDVLGITDDNKELDIYVPSKKVAVEFDGDIWHSEAFKKDAKDYHLKKTIACEQKGIRLIHVFSDEWENKQDIIKSIIASALGHYDKKYMARKLAFKEISYKIGSAFFKTNHIQGDAAAQHYFGLYDKDLLVQCISIGLNRFRKNKDQYELIRMASLLNTQVVGGFSKLIKHAMNELSIDSLESYVDRRLFNYSGYVSSGWIVEGSSSPRYFYTNGKTRENRQTYMKQSCLKKWPECTPDMTEHEMCLMHHLYRIYDCGTIKMKIATK